MEKEKISGISPIYPYLCDNYEDMYFLFSESAA